MNKAAYLACKGLSAGPAPRQPLYCASDGCTGMKQVCPRQLKAYKPAAAVMLRGLLCWLLAGAITAAAQNKPVTLPDTPGSFVDITAKADVHFLGKASHTPYKYLPETMGSGVALFDYDNDGRLDLFLVNGAPLASPGLLEPPLPPEARWLL